MSELFSIGERVKVLPNYGCPGEYRCHGIAPLNAGMIGIIEEVQPNRADQHYYRVGFDEVLDTEGSTHTHIHMWFAPQELESLP